MGRCKALCGHREFVRAYQTERWRQEERLDELSGGYSTEKADLVERDPSLRPVTFRRWLEQHAGGDDAHRSEGSV
jgi:hypothetical protein